MDKDYAIKHYYNHITKDIIEIYKNHKEFNE